jgi:hypothetical protein
MGIPSGVVDAFARAHRTWGVLAPRDPIKAAQFVRGLSPS